MNIKIGEKIRQLRQRDGRKQEDLATALGVSPQAISRWEANGGYPDMEMIPAIANYFNISIDELFGYSKDRGEKLKAILSKAENAINKQGNMTECVEMLRAAAEEFPSEPKVYINLGFALDLLGWEKHGARSYTKDGSDYAYEDTEYNSKNIYWQEALRAYEKALTLDISAEDKDVLTQRMVLLWAKIGYFDKAIALASKQNSLLMSREILLTLASEGETKDKYQGEAIIDLLTALKNVIVNAISSKISVFTQKEGINILTELAHMYETVFDDGRCGVGHYHISELYLHASVYEMRFGEEAEKAFAYFRKGFEHQKIYESIRCRGEYQYTAPLVSKVTFPSDNFPALSKSFWKAWIEVMPNDFVDRIKADPQFAECFN
ncbi:MAG: helix-turn-helix transcriptional regulator [Ruminococcaceae bacterium]|nr:helix-turn-helix transcriptional regulator [Oscillospiraceae bacterium]